MDANESLDQVEKLIEEENLEEAQKLLDSIEQKSGRKYFLQGKLFMAKKWFTEARRQYQKAVKDEPDNDEYKQALDDLNNFRKSTTLNEIKQMGGRVDFWEACCLCCGECLCQGLCEAICNGCS